MLKNRNSANQCKHIREKNEKEEKVDLAKKVKGG